MSFLECFHHQITGNPQGRKLVFLHGLMGSAANWRSIARHFESDFHILTFDQRGHGRSFHPESGYSPSDYAHDLTLILEELGWSSSALVGHSMGGRNALEFAARTPPTHKVEALVIEDIGPDANFEAIERIDRLLSLVPTPFRSRQAARDFFENDYAALISFYPQGQVVSRFLLSNIEQKPDGTMDWRFNREAILKSMREGRSEDRWDAFRNLKMPVLVVRGENSQDLSRATFERMLKVLPTTKGVEIAGAGHWVHFDKPDEFVQTLKSFFQTL
jgi:pimeloyl-ACP methyl ester carboxylesterase